MENADNINNNLDQNIDSVNNELENENLNNKSEDTKETINNESVTSDVEFEKIYKTSSIENNEVEPTVTVQPVKFASFDNQTKTYGEPNKNLDLLLDIKLQLTVELGRCELPIKKVLELTRGSIIELDKIAGEPVELFANGKLVALGEVVVIDDNFGLRITNITDPDERLKNL